MIRGGLPADSILECVGASACDLIVMGTHGRHGISYVFKGRVAEAVLRRGLCPVLAVRNQKVVPGRQRFMQMKTASVARLT